MTVASKLQQTLDIKQAIKVALQNKDESPSDDFSTYAGIIDGLATSGIAVPKVISPSGNDVKHSPVIETSRFGGLADDGSAEVHESTTWEFYRDSGLTDLIHSSRRDTANLTSYDLSEQGVALPPDQYVYIFVEYRSEKGTTADNGSHSFKTSELPSSITKGDVVAGQFDGHWVLMAPHKDRVLREWGFMGDSNPPVDSDIGVGKAQESINRTDAMASAGSPAASYCRSLGDYNLPTYNVMQFIAENRDKIDRADGQINPRNPTLKKIKQGIAEGAGGKTTSKMLAPYSRSYGGDTCYYYEFEGSDGVGLSVTQRDDSAWVIPVRFVKI